MPKDFEESYEAMRKEYEPLGYIPPPPLRFVWHSYWTLRPTKAYESPITHTDIKNFAELMRIELQVWEVNQIIDFDRKYYKFAKEHKE